MAFDAGTVIAHIKADITDFKEGIGEAKSSLTGLNSNFDKTADISKKFVAGMMVAGAGAVFLGKKIFDQAAAFEQSQIAFTTMLQSAEKADKLLAELAQFAKITPFELQGIEASAKQLLAMGSSADDLIPELKALGDISAGVGAPLDRLALNFGQVRLQGKLTGRELRDFAVNGVPLVAALSEQLGVSEQAIADMVSAGEISFKNVKDAMIAMTSEGAQFGNMMEKQSLSATGQISNLKDSISLLAREIGVILLPIVKNFITFMLDNVLPGVRSFSLLIRDNKEAVAAISIAIMVLMIPAFIAWAVAAGTAAVATIAATWPIIALAAAVGVAAYVILKNWDEIKAGTIALVDTIKSKFTEMVNSLKNIGGQIKDAIVRPFEDAWNKIKELADKIKDKLDFTKRHSPSVLDIVNRGVYKVNKALRGIEFATTLAPAMSSSVVQQGGQGVKVNQIRIDMAGAIISDEYAAQQMGEKIGDSIIRKLQLNVRF